MENIFIQRESEAQNIPSDSLLKTWCICALDEKQKHADITIRISDKAEIQTLNKVYRHKDYATNVLSFPSTVPEFCNINELGDIVICAEVVTEEAQTQSKNLEHHWAHMVVHGTLHLQGYDHVEDDEAEKMEALETKILIELGYSPPYPNE